MLAMATTTKRPAKTPNEPSTPAAGEEVAAEQPFLRFYHSAELREKTLTLLAAIEGADGAREVKVHRAALGDLVVELTNTGMDAYFMAPLRLAKPGFLTERTASMGLAGVERVMGSVVHKIIGNMDHAQLLSLCGSIRQLMR